MHKRAYGYPLPPCIKTQDLTMKSNQILIDSITNTYQLPSSLHQDSKNDHEINSDYVRFTPNHTPATFIFALGVYQRLRKGLKISKQSK